MDGPRWGVWVAALAAVATLACPATALAAPAWRGPEAVPPPSSGSTFNSQVAGTSDGRTVVIWRHIGLGGVADVWSSVRPPGGDFATPLEVTASPESQRPPALVAAPDGTAVAAWAGDLGGARRARAALLPPGGSAFGPPATVPGAYVDPGLSGDDIALAPGAGGEVVMAIAEGGSSTERRIHRSIRPAGGSFETAVPISAPNSFDPRAAGNNRGDVAILWRVVDSMQSSLAGTVRDDGVWHALSSAGPVLGSLPNRAHRVAVGPDGHVVAIWAQAPPGDLLVPARLYPAADRPPLPGTSATTSADFDIAVGPEGLAVAVWHNFSEDRIQASVAPPGERFGPVQNVSPHAPTADDVSNPQVEFDAGGRAIVTWHNDVASPAGYQAAVLTAAGTFDRLDPPAFEAQSFTSQLAADAAGNTLLLAFGLSPSGLRVASFDGAGPVLGPLSVPAGVSGAPLQLGVGAVDAWSPLGAATWSFGDGALGTGLTASHAYAAPGSYPASVTVVDSLGNASSAGATVEVGAPPAGGGGPGGGEPGGAAGQPPGGQPGDRTAPVIRRFGLSRQRFAVAPRKRRRSRASARRVPTGTTFRFDLSEAATLTIALERRTAGVRVRGRCRPRKAGRRRGRPCRRWVRQGALRARRPAGPGRLKFDGRVRRRALPPGRYRALATARDAAGNVTPRAGRARFGILDGATTVRGRPASR